MPKKQNLQKTNIIIIFIIFAFLVITGVVLSITGVIPQVAVNGDGSVSIGSSLLSLDQVDLTSNFGPLSGNVWVYTFKIGGSLGQTAKASVSPNDVGDVYSGDEKPIHDFDMTVFLNSQQCIYDIIPNQDLPVHGSAKFIEWFSFNCDFTQSRMNQNDRCGVNDGYHTFVDFDTNNCNAVCFRQLSADVARFENPNINTDFNVLVQSQGQSYSEDFETLGQARGVVGPNTYVEWLGNLDTGKACPDQGPFIPIYRLGQWNVHNRGAYDSWKNHFLSLAQVSNEQEAANWIALNDVLVNEAFELENFGSGFLNKFSLENGKGFLDLLNNVQYPVITAYIKADWIGIHTPIGEPQILEIDADNFESRGVVRVRLKNIGDETGSFETSINCPNPMDVSDRVVKTLGPGNTEDVFLQITASVAQSTTRTCTVVVDSVSKTITQDFTVTALPPPKFCEPGTRFCTVDNKGIEECTEDGLGYTKVEDCAIKCEFDDFSQPFCSEDQPPAPPTGSCKPWLSSALITIPNPFCALKDKLTLIAVILAVLDGLLIFGLGYNRFVKPKTKKQKADPVLFIIVLIFSLVAGVLTYLLVQLFFDFITSLLGITLIILTAIGIIILNNVIPGR